MKKVVLLLALCLLTFSVSAQRITSTKSNKRTYSYPVQPSFIYAGATYGTYHYEKGDDRFQDDVVGIQGGYLYSLAGDMNKSFTPYIGGEGLLGLSIMRAGMVVQVNGAIGVMVGQPSFRLDVRLQPGLTFWSNCYYEYFGNYYSVHNNSKALFQPNLALRVGMWINHFNLYVQYHYLFGIGMAWRF